ncbi:MAG: 2-oxoacid:acceptor oxidoreductase subunit alpha [Candidatus Thermoplasmatota archaeon]|jgi:2-oxoglutarate ferredoxin oxidoreductase subunit alpha|nr:2-oxoacid:acceptor oxidoreductase subunit alpha [Candidatus Thermoplasmatota archaeon]
MKKDLNLMVAGPQGSGINFTSDTFAKVMARQGYYVYTNAELFSTIKGDHSYFRVRVSDQKIESYSERVDILIPLDAKSVIIHKGEVSDDGMIISEEKVDDKRFATISYRKILESVATKFNKNVSELNVMKNTVSLAAALKIVGIESKNLKDVITENFASRKIIAEMNNAVVDEVYNEFSFNKTFSLPPVEKKKRMLINSAEAVGMGKVLAGMKFQSYYPITPASDESNYLETLMDKYGFVVEQTEDEIAAINMAIAAANTGLRSSTSTSGPGFDLMVEALSYSGMTETPVVIFYYQRAGPSTGMPTRHEQGDLKFATTASHGEFPRVILTPGDNTEAFYDAVDSFNIAEHYQLPVIVLLDKSMAMSNTTTEVFDLSGVRIDRGKLVLNETSNYKRYKLTEDGISPRTVPGVKGGIFTIAGDEHEEDGHIFSEDPDNRIIMMNKRMGKMNLILKEIGENKKVKFYGKPENKKVILSWGSPKGAIKDALESFPDISFLQVRMIEPFPSEEVMKYLKGKYVIDIEQNYSGQLADLLREKTGIVVDSRILKFNGRPMAYEELMDAIKKAQTEKKVVLSYA